MRSNKQQVGPNVRAAAQSEATAISSLAIRAKAHWGYSEEFLAACREELTYSEAQIDSTNYEFWVCEVEGRIAGFYAVELLNAEEAELEALFVEPDMIGQGIGRTLIEHAKQKSAALGNKRLIIQGDPNARKFYESAGGVRTGQRESGSIPGRVLPIFTIRL